jgi:hypothetical protein
MPRVGNKHYPYTKKGQADASAAKKQSLADAMSRAQNTSSRHQQRDAARGGPQYGSGRLGQGQHGPNQPPAYDGGEGRGFVRDGDRRGFAPPGRAPVIGKNPYKGTTKKRKTNPSPYSTSDR